MNKKKYFDIKPLNRTFRIREEAVEIYRYLEYKAVCDNISKYKLFDKIVEFSIRKILIDELNEGIYEFNGKREIKGFTLSEEVNRALETFICINNLKKGEAVELLVAVYAKYNLNKVELEKLPMYMI